MKRKFTKLNQNYTCDYIFRKLDEKRDERQWKDKAKFEITLEPDDLPHRLRCKLSTKSLALQGVWDCRATWVPSDSAPNEGLLINFSHQRERWIGVFTERSQIDVQDSSWKV